MPSYAACARSAAAEDSWASSHRGVRALPARLAWHRQSAIGMRLRVPRLLDATCYQRGL